MKRLNSLSRLHHLHTHLLLTNAPLAKVPFTEIQEFLSALPTKRTLTPLQGEGGLEGTPWPLLLNTLVPYWDIIDVVSLAFVSKKLNQTVSHYLLPIRQSIQNFKGNLLVLATYLKCSLQAPAGDWVRHRPFWVVLEEEKGVEVLTERRSLIRVQAAGGELIVAQYMKTVDAALGGVYGWRASSYTIPLEYTICILDPQTEQKEYLSTSQNNRYWTKDPFLFFSKYMDCLQLDTPSSVFVTLLEYGNMNSEFVDELSHWKMSTEPERHEQFRYFFEFLKKEKMYCEIVMRLSAASKFPLLKNQLFLQLHNYLRCTFYLRNINLTKKLKIADDEFPYEEDFQAMVSKLTLFNIINNHLYDTRNELELGEHRLAIQFRVDTPSYLSKPILCVSLCVSLESAITLSIRLVVDTRSHYISPRTMTSFTIQLLNHTFGVNFRIEGWNWAFLTLLKPFLAIQPYWQHTFPSKLAYSDSYAIQFNTTTRMRK
eukprot:TRINITY_DN23201_c0_g1_i1.p1 TRINITY_DN23201_c0_g1~~TRINITY_DN23201_c0_g1_i1.p1  ORF type:complete len:485 (-),score=76.86 TRINITY_DN23201_c0_g1_i1:4-1458(-)